MIDQIRVEKECNKEWREINTEEIEKELRKKYANLEKKLYEIEINEMKDM